MSSKTKIEYHLYSILFSEKQIEVEIVNLEVEAMVFAIEIRVDNLKKVVTLNMAWKILGPLYRSHFHDSFSSEFHYARHFVPASELFSYAFLPHLQVRSRCYILTILRVRRAKRESARITITRIRDSRLGEGKPTKLVKK